jgi:hypothetical protein
VRGLTAFGNYLLVLFSSVLLLLLHPVERDVQRSEDRVRPARHVHKTNVDKVKLIH